jgi:ribosome-binding ATPase YchF (GTP1/OBG family)
MEKIDPIADIEIVHYELILSDLDMLERRIVKAQKAAKSQIRLRQNCLRLWKKLEQLWKTGN